MENKNYKRVNLTSSNLSEEKLAELSRILPEAFCEGKIDWQKLKEVLGSDFEPGVEKFSFSWAGKTGAVKNVLVPSKATLKPAKDESVKFDESENIFIEGDNLEVLKLLQKAYFEKVKMIYIDPPYNTGGDFVYKDDFSAPLKGYLEQTGQIDGDGNKMQTNRETNGRYHSDWLSMMYPRLKLAWNLLRDDGVIFISIDDNEVHHLRMLMDEIFGEENFVAQIIWKKRGGAPNDKPIGTTHEYIVFYAKNIVSTNLNWKIREDKQLNRYKNPDNHPKGPWAADNLMANVKGGRYVKSLYFPIINPNTGKEHYPSSDGNWRFNKDKIEQLLSNNEIYFSEDGKGRPKLKRFLCDVKEGVPFSTNWDYLPYNNQATAEIQAIFGNVNIFDTPKPTALIKELVNLSTNKDDLVLDFFAGAGTTAQAILQKNQEDGGKRKFILIQLPEWVATESIALKYGFETVAEITKERIRKAINGYGETPQPINDGFKVFKLDKSNYPENNFEIDPEISEEENKAAFLKYLNKARQAKLFEKTQELDVVFENIIKEGLSLNSKIQKTKIAESAVYQIADGEKQLLICLENKIFSKTIKELTQPAYKGKLFICLDNALDDTTKANLALNVELKTI